MSSQGSGARYPQAHTGFGGTLPTSKPGSPQSCRRHPSGPAALQGRGQGLPWMTSSMDTDGTGRVPTPRPYALFAFMIVERLLVTQPQGPRKAKATHPPALLPAMTTRGQDPSAVNCSAKTESWEERLKLAQRGHCRGEAHTSAPRRATTLGIPHCPHREVVPGVKRACEPRERRPETSPHKPM